MGHETSIKAFPLTILRFFVFSESESSIADHKTIIHMQYEAVSKKKIEDLSIQMGPALHREQDCRCLQKP